jgi:two-component sensor histidine kinase
VLSDAISALRHGAWDFVTKPILEMGVLEHSIESVLERARLLQENEEYHLHLEERVKSQTKLLRAEIEERERTEVRLKEMLGERDVLLKEVHHRVKNNLQLVSSLLSLNSRFSSNSEVRRILLESRNKIRSMWLAHELLYSSAELSRIRLPDYFRKIVNLLAGSGLEAQDLKFNVDVDDIRISISLAIPCGLIVTELVTNAMRHAFDGRQTGSVGLTARSKDNNLTIELIDDGIGFPEGKGLNTTETLGLQIVKRLVAQLHGEIELQSASGRTRIQVVFPLS